MKKNGNKYNQSIIEKTFNQYKIKLIPQPNSIIISIQSYDSNKIFESQFYLVYLQSFKLLNSCLTNDEIIQFISLLIERKNIKIEENKFNLKLFLFPILLNHSYIELILNQQDIQSNNKKFDKENYKNLFLKKFIKGHDNCINKISIFPSGNLISVSNDKSIKIYNNKFNLLQHIPNAHDDWINYVDIKDENNFVTCSYDKNIKTWIKKEKKFTINKIIYNSHKYVVSKIIYYGNTKLISCSQDETIKIWEENNNYYQNITILTHFKMIFSILLLEDKNIIISGGFDGIKFWNLYNLELIKTFNDIFCGSWNGICRIDNDKIITQSIDGDNEISLKIISILNKCIIKEINFPFYCFGINLIDKKGIFLVGGDSNDIKIYNKDNYENIQTIKNSHIGNILGFIELKNGTIASYGDDGIINIWSFK